MATLVTAPEVERTGTFVLAVEPDTVKRFGGLVATLTADVLPDDRRLTFLTLDLQRSRDDGKTWESLLRCTRSGKPRAEPTVIAYQETNRDGVALPIDGDVRLVVTPLDAYRTAMTLDRLDAVEPPPLREAHQSVAHDGTANATGTANFVTSISVSKTTAGTDRMAVAAVRWAAIDGTISTITYGGTGMTLGNDGTTNASAQSGAGFLSAARLYHPASEPQTASSTVTVTFADDLNAALAVTSFNGVDTTTPVRSSSVVTSTSAASLTVSGTSSGDMAVDALAAGDPDTIPPTVAGGMTSVQSVSVGGAPMGFSASYEAATGASVGVSWTVGAFDSLAYVAMALAQAAGGAAGNPHYAYQQQ